MRPILLVMLAACATPKRIGYTSQAREDPTAPPSPVIVPEGTCPATLRVKVVDPVGVPVVGAEISVVRSIYLNAPSTVPVHLTYRTLPVFSGATGEAMICVPDRMPYKSVGMFEYTHGGSIEVQKRGRMTTVAAPLQNPIVLR